MTIKLTWYGHAALGIDIGGYSVLVDPFLSENPSAPVSPDSLTADYILISHGHGDHVGDAVSIASRTGATVISNYEIANWFGEQGVEKVHAQHIGGGYSHPFGHIKLTLALHGSGLPDGSYGGNPCGFLLAADEKLVYLACDTGLFGDMALLGNLGLDMAVLPIGDNFTMGPEDAHLAVKMLCPHMAIPVHYNTWPLIEQDPVAWKRLVEETTSTTVYPLRPGESVLF